MRVIRELQMWAANDLNSVEPPDLLRNTNSAYGLTMKWRHSREAVHGQCPRKKGAQRMGMKEKIVVETQPRGDSLNARAHHGTDPKYEVTFQGHDKFNQPDSPALFSSCT